MTRGARQADPSPAQQLDLPWSLPEAQTPTAVPLRPLAAEPEAAVLAPSALFRHPQAAREITLGHARIAYAFQRARRRTIGMVVSADGLSVRAPRWVGVAEVEAALRGKSAWIQAKLAEQGERARRDAAARIDWRDGARVPFLGQPVVVVLDPRVVGAQLDSGDRQPPAGGPPRGLRVGLPHTATAEQLRDVVQAWLKRQARRVFEERCAHYAPRLGVRVQRLALSAAQTRWGSASADGTIRLNWRLVHFALPTIDYVVVHELAHLRHMDHSPRFWDVVRSVMPDMDVARSVLREGAVPRME